MRVSEKMNPVRPPANNRNVLNLQIRPGVVCFIHSQVIMTPCDSIGGGIKSNFSHCFVLAVPLAPPLLSFDQPIEHPSVLRLSTTAMTNMPSHIRVPTSSDDATRTCPSPTLSGRTIVDSPADRPHVKTLHKKKSSFDLRADCLKCQSLDDDEPSAAAAE